MKVAEEVDEQGSDLAIWLKANKRSVTHMLPRESETYMTLIVTATPKIGDGEAVAIAIAHHRTLSLVIEDEAARAVAAARGVGCLYVREILESVRLI